MLAADLEQLMDALELARVTLCGVSVGGQVALQVAHDRPGQVEGLILCDTAFRIGDARAVGAAHRGGNEARAGRRFPRR